MKVDFLFSNNYLIPIRLYFGKLFLFVIFEAHEKICKFNEIFQNCLDLTSKVNSIKIRTALIDRYDDKKGAQTNLLNFH